MVIENNTNKLAETIQGNLKILNREKQDSVNKFIDLTTKEERLLEEKDVALKNTITNKIVDVINEGIESYEDIHANIKVFIEKLKKIGFNLEKNSLIIKNSVKGQRLKNYLSIINEKLESNEQMSELETMHPDDIKRMTEMETSLSSMLNRVEKADEVTLSLMLNGLKPKIETLDKKKDLDFKETSNKLLFYAESTYIQSRLSYLESERQKQYLNEVSKEARAQTEETIEEYQNKYIKHRNEHEDYIAQLRSYYSSTFDIKYITDAKKKKYTTDLQKNLDKTDNETMEFYKAFTKVFDLTPENYKEFMDEEKGSDGYFELDPESQKNIMEDLSMDDMQEIIQTIYKINSNYLQRAFFIELIQQIKN